MDGTLIDDLRKVALTTEVGNIRLKNVTADEINLSSQIGDVSLDGIIDGNVVIETFGDGDVSLKGKTVYGSGLVISTDDGDINLWSECQTDECVLTTRNGNIIAGELFGTSVSIIVSEAGSVKANGYGGAIETTINQGNMTEQIRWGEI